jgi:hypothetical protein
LQLCDLSLDLIELLTELRSRRGFLFAGELESRNVGLEGGNVFLEDSDVVF